MSDLHTIDEIVSEELRSRIRLEAARDTHQAIVESINHRIESGQVDGIPYRVGEETEVTDGRYLGRSIRVGRVYLLHTIRAGKHTYAIKATGAVIRQNGTPGMARASVAMEIELE